jgi:6-pyruvoyltetrahydropterin/6-carboxytetrahydropterin synthase
MLTVTRTLEFDAAHRLLNHESKCATLHGHRYKVEVTATAQELDSLGRVIDFSVLKEKIGAWIDQNWDHTSLIYRADERTLKALGDVPSTKEIFVADWNPTAENIADYLLRTVCPRELKGTNVQVISVTVWETPNCKAEARL